MNLKPTSLNILLGACVVSAMVLPFVDAAKGGGQSGSSQSLQCSTPGYNAESLTQCSLNDVREAGSLSSQLDAKESEFSKKKESASSIKRPKTRMLPQSETSLEDIFEASNDFERIKDAIPTLNGTEVKARYRDIKNAGDGTTSFVLKTKVRDGRDVALRCADGGWGSWSPINTVRAYAFWTPRLMGVSDFLPKLHAVWKAPADAIVPEKNSSEHSVICLEMDFLETNYEKEYGHSGFSSIKDRMSDRVVMEEYIGKWALGGGHATDPDGDVLRHYMLTHDEKFAVYNIGGEEFLLGPGFSPRKIDLDFFGLSSNDNYLTEKFVANCFWRYSEGREYREVDEYRYRRGSKEAQGFMENVCRGEGLFASIKKYFWKYRVSETNPLPPPERTNYYHIPSARLIN